MNLTRFWRASIALAALCAAVPALADTDFRIRRTNRDDIPLGKGQCDIRLQVDNEVEVAVRRDFVSIRTLSGRDAYDNGSECNAPLPDREIPGFHFEVKESRGEIRLVAPPDGRNDFTAIVHIRDTPSGFGRYHFRLTWAMTGLGDLRRDSDHPPGAFASNNALHYSSHGRGASNLAGAGSERLFDATVDIDRGGHIQVAFRTDSGRPLMFSGTVVSREGDTWKADVVADDRLLRMRGPMFIAIDARDNVYRIRLEAENGRDHLRVDWDRERR